VPQRRAGWKKKKGKQALQHGRSAHPQTGQDPGSLCFPLADSESCGGNMLEDLQLPPWLFSFVTGQPEMCTKVAVCRRQMSRSEHEVAQPGNPIPFANAAVAKPSWSLQNSD